MATCQSPTTPRPWSPSSRIGSTSTRTLGSSIAILAVYGTSSGTTGTVAFSASRSSTPGRWRRLPRSFEQRMRHDPLHPEEVHPAPARGARDHAPAARVLRGHGLVGPAQEERDVLRDLRVSREGGDRPQEGRYPAPCMEFQ